MTREELKASIAAGLDTTPRQSFAAVFRCAFCGQVLGRHKRAGTITRIVGDTTECAVVCKKCVQDNSGVESPQGELPGNHC